MTRSAKSRYYRGMSHRKKRSARLSLIILLSLLVGIVATVGYVWERVQVIRQQLVISELKGQIHKLETDNEYLKTDLLCLSGTKQLESAAKRFGFTYPAPNQIIRLPK